MTQTFETQLRINGKDSSSAAFASAARNARGFAKTIQAASRQARIAGAIMTAAITAPLIAFGKSAIDSAMQAENGVAAVQSVLKSMGPVAGRTATQLAA